MVRHCAVRGCNNTDMSILCHRFPRRREAFEQWQRSLQLVDTEADLLMHRFVVCTLHFKVTDYRNSGSRMLNTVAVPTLSIHSKDCFYYAPTSLLGSSPISYAKAETVSSTTVPCSNSIKKPVEEFTPQPESPISVDPEEDMFVSSSLIIERVEPEPPEAKAEIESEEDVIYFIEEEIPAVEVTSEEKCPLIEERLQESSPIESPEAKRFKPDTAEVLNEQPPDPDPDPPLQEIEIDVLPTVECQNASAQTDDVEIVSPEDQLQRRMVDQCYPEYAGYSRLDFAKQLREKDERLAELTKKLANFEAAHAAMMKTMEAFKTLVN